MNKAKLVPETGEDVHFMFNPSEITVSKTVSWKGETKGQNAPKLEFDSGKSGTTAMALLFDTTHNGKPVTDETNKLLKLMEVVAKGPTYDKTNHKGRPPTVKLVWGTATSHALVVESVQLKFTYFASDGTPLRAKATVKLKQYENESSETTLQNPTSFTPRPHAVHTVSAGETLDRIAHQYYGDSSKWRELASSNRIVDPLAISPGSLLVIPERKVRHRGE